MSGLSFPSRAKKARNSEFVMTKVRDRSESLRAFLEVCLHNIQELEEVRDFSCSEATYSRVVLVRVVLASKLSVLDFYFSLGVISMVLFHFNDTVLSHNILADCRMWRRREWGAMAAVG